MDKYRKGKVKRTLRKRSEIEPEIERLQSIEDLSIFSGSTVYLLHHGLASFLFRLIKLKSLDGGEAKASFNRAYCLSKKTRNRVI